MNMRKLRALAFDLYFYPIYKQKSCLLYSQQIPHCICQDKYIKFPCLPAVGMPTAGSAVTTYINVSKIQSKYIHIY